MLLALMDGDKLIKLSFSKITDYAKAKLGVPSSTAYFHTRLARELKTRPLLKKAVACGHVKARNAMVVMNVAVGEFEEAWTAAAMVLDEKTLKKAVRASGGEAMSDEFEVETLVLRMTGEQQDRVDAAISVARELDGFDLPRWRCEERIAMEALGSVAQWIPEEAEKPDESAKQKKFRKDWLKLWKARGGEVRRTLGVVADAERIVDGGLLLDDGDMKGLSAKELHQLAVRLAKSRKKLIAPKCEVLALFFDQELWSVLGYRSKEQYSRERLGMCGRRVNDLAMLGRKMRRMPRLREALLSGEITLTQAIEIARHATPDGVAEEIEEAKKTSYLKTERKSRERTDRKNRGKNKRRVWGPRQATETISLAIDAVQAFHAEQGERISKAEAFARMADHFLEVWWPKAKASRRPKWQHDILMRHGGLCAWPECSRTAAHLHHLEYQARGGTDEASNLTAVCNVHHLRGIHLGYLLVRGRAGELLVFKASATGEVWQIVGEDEVRRTG